MKTENNKKSNLINELQQFTGTVAYHCFSPMLFPSFVLTDGCSYLASEAQCYWLFDLIASSQRLKAIKALDIQFWTLTVHPNKSATLICEIDEGEVVHSEQIEWTDFPLESIKIWVGDEENLKVAILTSEY